MKLTQRYDQIGLFFRDDDGVGKGFPTHAENKTMGEEGDDGYDYGVFNFTELFSKALMKKAFGELSKDEQNKFVRKYDQKVSDHMPIWLRLKFTETSNKRKADEIK